MWGSNDVESMSSSRRLTEPGGTRSVGAPICRYFSGWEGHSDMNVVVEWPRLAFRVSTMPSFPFTPSVWGPNRARIASDRRDIQSHLLFVDTQVESKLLSSCIWQADENFFLDHVVWLSKRNSVFPRKYALSVCLETIRWLWGCRLWEGPDDDI